jgi:hypothetical protein
MIILRFPTLPVDGELQWATSEFVYRHGQLLQVYLGDIDPSTLERVVINGAIIAPDQIALCTPLDGDEITVIPKVGSSGRGVVAGVLGAIAVVALIGATGGAASPILGFFGSYFGAVTGGFAISSLLYSLAHPPRTHDGDKTGTTYTFDGLQNEDREGTAQPVVMGDIKTAGTRVNSFIRVGLFPDPSDPTQAKPGERSYQLINVSKAKYGIQAISDVKVNGEPISNFKGADYAYTLGESPEQWYDSSNSPIARPEAFDVDANTFAVNTLLTTTPFVYTTSAITNVDAIELIISAPLGIIHTHKGTDSDNWTRFKVRYRVHGTVPWTNYGGPGFDAATGIRKITLKQQTTYLETVRIAKPPYGNIPTPARYDVEVTWVDAHFTSPSGTDIDQWQLYLASVTEEVGGAATKPGYALLAVSALAVEHLTGQPPTITCQCRGIKVPWHDGVSWQAPTWVGPDPTHPIGRNPAWLMLEMHRDKEDKVTGYDAWGAGIDDTRIYLPDWVSFAAKCNTSEHVDDSDGNHYDEPRHQLDITLNQQRSFDQIVRDLMATARGAPCMSGNGAQHGVFYDDNDTPVQVVTIGNMVGGSFQPVYDFSPRTNTFDVTYQDATNEYETVTRPIVNAHLVTTLGKKTLRESISMLGVTRFSQILRDATYNLRKHEYTKSTLTFEMRTDAILWRVGQVINVQHDLPQWGFGGRVRLDNPNNTTTKVATSLKAKNVAGSIYITDIDGNDILINIGVTNYEVRVRLADGSGEEGQRRDVSAVAVSAAGYLVCTVSTPFSIAPAYNDVFAFGEYQKSVKPYRCIGISRSAHSFRKVECTEFNAGIYAAAGTVEVIDYSALPRYGGPPPPIDPTSCKAHEDLSDDRAGNSVQSAVVVNWTKPARVSGYGFYGGADVEVSYDGGTVYTLLQQRVPGNEYRWNAAPRGVALKFRVTPVSTAGRPNVDGRAVSNSVTCGGRAIVPQNPTTVAIGANATRRRTVRSQISPGDPLALINAFDKYVTWAFTDTVNPSGTLLGFRVIVYDSVGGTPTHPLFDSGVISDPAARRSEVANLTIENASTFVAAVQSVYIDGYVSALATSSGLVLDPNTYEPVVRGGDDRNAAAYPESFNVAALPTGFYVFNATHAFGNGEIQLTKTGAGTQLSWHFDEWGAAYLDGVRYGPGAYAWVRIAFDVAPAPGTTMTITTKANPAGPDVLQTVTLVPDTAFHTYRIPFGTIPNLSFAGLAGVHMILELSSVMSVGQTCRVTAVGIGYETIDLSNDGYMDRALNARNQFGRDNVGLGFFLQSPIRQPADPSGNVVVIEKNGMFWLRSGGGMDIPVKRAIKAVMHGCFDKEFFNWGSHVGSAGGLIEPSLPTPVASSKVRILLERAHDIPLDVAPSFYPQRTQLEALEITQSGFRLAAHKIEGPGYGGAIEAPTGGGGNSNGWAGSAIKKSGLTLASSSSVVNNGDAWYDVFNDLFFGSGFTVGLFYYSRCVLWVAVQMPTSKKADGTYYYADLDFDVHYSKAVNGTGSNPNPFHFNGWGSTIYGASGYRMRVYTDGQIYRYPLVFTPMYGIWSPVMKVDWYGQTLESGGSAPTSVWLDRFEGSAIYVTGGTGQESQILGNDLNVTMVEEF